MDKQRIDDILIKAGKKIAQTGEQSFRLVLVLVDRDEVITKEWAVSDQIDRVLHYAIHIAEAEFGIEPGSVFERVRKRDIVDCRRALAHLMCEMFGTASLQWIGNQLGGYDHSTIIHYRDTSVDLITTDPLYRLRYENLTNKVKSYANKHKRATASSEELVEEA